MRKLETGHAQCSQAFIDACRTAAAAATENLDAGVLGKLAESLQQIRDRDSARIDIHRGVERTLPLSHIGWSDVDEIAGEWTAIWQTSYQMNEAVLRETVEIKPASSGWGRFAIANHHDATWLETYPIEEEPDHFQWIGDGSFVQSWVSGRFASVSTRARVAGAFHLKLHNFGKALTGRWIGVSHDSEVTAALLIMARTEKTAVARFQAERDRVEIPPMAIVADEWQ